MVATCYRCVSHGDITPGEPFGACDVCSSFACIKCGVRVKVICEFKCVTCYPGSVLLPQAGLGPAGGGPGGGGPPGGGPSGGGPSETRLFASTEEFEVLEPVLAEMTRSERGYYGHDVGHFLGIARDYAFDEARREEIDRGLGYEGYVDAVEQARRADMLAGARRLARDVEAAAAADRLRADLLADAFGVAQYAIGVPPGEAVPPERLATLRDQRLRFVVGAAAVATGPPVGA